MKTIDQLKEELEEIREKEKQLRSLVNQAEVKNRQHESRIYMLHWQEIIRRDIELTYEYYKALERMR